MSRTIELHIDTIGAGGAGVGRDSSRRVIFVQRTAPGETVRARVVEEKARWARAELVSIIEPAIDRRDAPCRFYDRCGGCTLEHLQYPAQLAAKARIVSDALSRIGGLDAVTPEVVASPTEFHYRNRMSFTLARLRDGRVLGQLLDEFVGLGRVTAAEDGPRVLVYETDLVRLLLPAPEVRAIDVAYEREDAAGHGRSRLP